MHRSVKSAARSAEGSSALRVLARGGYVASGLIHIIVGVLAIAVAWSGHGESDQAGALTAIASAPLGFAALWALALLLWALGVYHGIHGVALRIDGRMRRWGRRVAEWGQAVLFLAMGVIAAAVALGARPDPDQSAQEASRSLLTVPAGPLLLAAIGIAIGIGGVVWVVMGFRRSFHARVTLPAGTSGHAISALGAVGFVAKGAALLVVGALFVIAALRADPNSAGGLDAAIESIRELPFGPVLVTAVGAGFLAYGVFCGFRARYADL
ncbi:DUF1206 domain-containing protein [Leucobacter sp. CSA1]|uniref:DUF1206 domain-containing protein n=1 Tax=Leucobacter chromiisoli TaxID=2796471 RepID=A0A934Q738_9MICO|nr:DUF1206 domain-containing protein [Leucobacter chromiisoli]MBK0418047.1 DUF1206 domain-containing protein [Leucobacter chromiisoli]